MAIFLAFYFIACTSIHAQKGELEILDVRTTKEPAENLQVHNPYDVEVFRIRFMGEGYKVRYYQKENNSLTSHEAMYMLPDEYDKAIYNWTSDTSLIIRLHNTKTKQEKKFEVFGYGSTSGIRD
ncbi:MAG: hypothetical protein H0V91_09550 [Flavisolibacter sp.]|nr:hypothetical protein [Flavisolibacter sp.]